MNRGNREFKKGLLISIVVGTIVDIVMCGALAMLIPIFVLRGSLPINAMPILVAVTLALSCFLGASFSAAIQHERKWIAGVGSAAVFLVLLISYNMLMLDEITNNAYVVVLACLIGSVVAVFVQITKKSISKKGRKRVRSR